MKPYHGFGSLFVGYFYSIEKTLSRANCES